MLHPSGLGPAAAPDTTVERARELRTRLSPPEVSLWSALKGRGLDGLKFRRQHPLGPYILDFYCPEAKLAVEIDGWGHNMGDQPKHDAQRDAWVAGQGVQTIRVSAADVMKDRDEVLQMILRAARG